MRNYKIINFIFLILLITSFKSKAQVNSGKEQPLNSGLKPKTMASKMDGGMMLRIAEIEIFPQYLEEYLTILKTEAAASVEVEPGVLAIFPMQQKDHPNQIRIVEMYANKAAYQFHLKTPHFLDYKIGTQKMVKSLKLVDMESIDPESIKKIFRKIE